MPSPVSPPYNQEISSPPSPYNKTPSPEISSTLLPPIYMYSKFPTLPHELTPTNTQLFSQNDTYPDTPPLLPPPVNGTHVCICNCSCKEELKKEINEIKSKVRN